MMASLGNIVIPVQYHWGEMQGSLDGTDAGTCNNPSLISDLHSWHCKLLNYISLSCHCPQWPSFCPLVHLTFYPRVWHQASVRLHYREGMQPCGDRVSGARLWQINMILIYIALAKCSNRETVCRVHMWRQMADRGVWTFLYRSREDWDLLVRQKECQHNMCTAPFEANI